MRGRRIVEEEGICSGLDQGFGNQTRLVSGGYYSCIRASMLVADMISTPLRAHGGVTRGKSKKQRAERDMGDGSAMREPGRHERRDEQRRSAGDEGQNEERKKRRLPSFKVHM